MSWVRAYIGIPYSEANCWEICGRALERERGIHLPDFTRFYDRTADPERNIDHAKAVDAIIHLETTGGDWQRVTVPMPFDVILIRVFGYIAHCALVVDAQLALTTTTQLRSHLISYHQRRYSRRIEGFYRHVQLAHQAP